MNKNGNTPSPEERRRIVDDAMRDLRSELHALPPKWEGVRQKLIIEIGRIKASAYEIIKAAPDKYERNAMSQFLQDQLWSVLNNRNNFDREELVFLVTISFHHELLSDVENMLHGGAT